MRQRPRPIRARPLYRSELWRGPRYRHGRQGAGAGRQVIMLEVGLPVIGVLLAGYFLFEFRP
ncbi:hypothetical protein X566_19105 [Afipia sp. P52-10]|nr:hypothetical protein X566_19105 [Afipia sp. P52-10]